jgi:creatinine amidohydrolase
MSAMAGPRLDRLTAQPVETGDYDKAMLPLGATEYHGPHLPYGSDTMAAETLAVAFARELGRALVLPPMPFGVSHHHLAFPWTVSVRPETLALVIQDVAASLLGQGIRKLVIVSAHDGNHPVANGAARRLAQDHGVSVALFTGWQRQARMLLAGRRDIDLDHGGQSETSLMLYAAGETVTMDAAPKEASERVDHPVELIGSYRDVAPRGYSGNAAAATREEGAAIIAALVGFVVPHLRQLDRHGWRGGEWLSGVPGGAE